MMVRSMPLASGEDVGMIDGEIRVLPGQIAAAAVTWIFAAVGTFIL